MAEDETVIREVDQSIAEDRQAEFLKKRGPALLGLAGAIVVGVAGWQFWKGQNRAVSEEASTAFWNAERSFSDDAETGKAAFELVSEGDSKGYAALAQFRLASFAIGEGDIDGALAHYASVYGNNAIAKRLRDVASLKAGYLSIDKGRDQVLAIVGSLEPEANPIGAHAREIIALSALEAGDYQTAESMFLQAASSTDAPLSLRTRAEQYAALASAGKAGVALETKTGVEGFLDALDDRGSDLGTLLQDRVDARTEQASDVVDGETEAHDDHDGHGHGEGEPHEQGEGEE